MKTIEDLKTFEDACTIQGLDPKEVLAGFPTEIKGLDPNFLKSVIAYTKLTIIISAANKISNNGKEWNPDWDDSSELKYEPWFYMGSWGFRADDYGDWCTLSVVGSRLCFHSSGVCKYIATQFVDLYKDFHKK